MVALPAAMAVTVPEASITAMAGLRLAQLPAGVAFASIVVLPVHRSRIPVIADTSGNGLTITVIALDKTIQLLALPTATSILSPVSRSTRVSVGDAPSCIEMPF